MTTTRLHVLEPQLAELTPEEMRELAAELMRRAGPTKREPNEVDWSRWEGVLSKNGPDPVEYQQTIRAEWDERDRQLQAIWDGTSGDS